MISATTRRLSLSSLFFFFNDTATTEIYTLSLHDALPIYPTRRHPVPLPQRRTPHRRPNRAWPRPPRRSEEHTSELQSHLNLVCRLLLEKKKKHKKEIERNQPSAVYKRVQRDRTTGT